MSELFQEEGGIIRTLSWEEHEYLGSGKEARAFMNGDGKRLDMKLAR